MRVRGCRHCRRPLVEVRGLVACPHCDRQPCTRCGKGHGPLLGMVLDFLCNHPCDVCAESKPFYIHGAA